MSGDSCSPSSDVLLLLLLIVLRRFAALFRFWVSGEKLRPRCARPEADWDRTIVEAFFLRLVLGVLGLCLARSSDASFSRDDADR